MRRPVNVPTFNKFLYQWAATLTQSGANYPFASVLAADMVEGGCQVMSGSMVLH